MVPVSILKPSLGIVRDNTLRLWRLSDRSIISTITIPNVSFSERPGERMGQRMN